MYATRVKEFVGCPFFEQMIPDGERERSRRKEFWSAVESKDVGRLLHMKQEGVDFKSFNDGLKSIVFRAVAVNSSIDVVRLLVDVMGHDSLRNLRASDFKKIQ